MSDIHKFMGNVRVVNGRLSTPPENEPGQYAGRGYPYLNTATSRFYQEMAKYATDYCKARAQGLDPADFFAWEEVTLRLSDIIRTSAALQRQFDNHKMILLDAMRYAYIPRGAKFVVMGSTWLCTNPKNLSGGDGMGVVQRCNQTWNHLDWYGNLVKEPIVFETEILRANAPDPQYNVTVVKGYYNIKCQRNPDTEQIDDNTRILLGKSAYVVTGFSDLEQEFTGEDGSGRLLQFTLRRDEVNRTVDDTENRVAGGLAFQWEVLLAGPETLTVGTPVQYTASSLRCGDGADGDPEHPVTYLWEVSDEGVASVDGTGLVTPLAEGTFVLTVTVAQNPALVRAVEIAVSAVRDTVQFAATPPESLRAFGTLTLTALPPEGEEDVLWSFTGAAPGAYSVEINGNEAAVSCWSGSITPLTVTAQSGGSAVSAVIELIGL